MRRTICGRALILYFSFGRILLNLLPEEITKEKEMELFTRIRDRYDKQTTAYYAASHLWIDAIIDPIETRKVISMGIEMANHQPKLQKYNVGLIQT